MSLRVIVFILSGVVAGGLHADEDLDKIFGDEYLLDNEFKKLKEKNVDIIIPTFPKEKDLIPIQMEHAKRKFYIDAKSLTVARDQVPRYTVVIESPSGTRSVFYEAVRCQDKHYKTYAYGDVRKKKFIVLKDPQWKPITNTIGPFRYRTDLVDVFMCNQEVARRKVREIVQALKYPPEMHAPEMTD